MQGGSPNCSAQRRRGKNRLTRRRMAPAHPRSSSLACSVRPTPNCTGFGAVADHACGGQRCSGWGWGRRLASSTSGPRRRRRSSPCTNQTCGPQPPLWRGLGGLLEAGSARVCVRIQRPKSDLHKPPLRLYHAAHRDTAATQATVWCIFICRHSSARLRLFSFVFPDLDCVVGCHATRCDDHLARVAAHRQHRAAMPNPAAHTRHTASPRRQRQAVERLAGVQRCLKPSMSLGSTRERE